MIALHTAGTRNLTITAYLPMATGETGPDASDLEQLADESGVIGVVVIRHVQGSVMTFREDSSSFGYAQSIVQDSC